MSYDVNAEIGMRRSDVVDQLNSENPYGVERMATVIEGEIEKLMQDMRDNFCVFFCDNAISHSSFSGLSEADREAVTEWEEEMMDQAILRWRSLVALRERCDKKGNEYV